jgi:hypothetical protein
MDILLWIIFGAVAVALAVGSYALVRRSGDRGHLHDAPDRRVTEAEATMNMGNVIDRNPFG